MLHYLFRDAGKSFDFTFGSIVIFVAAMYYARHCYESFRMGQALTDATEYQSELLYRWLANGGEYDAFWKLSDLAQSDADMSDWWSEEAVHLLGSATGKSVVPG